MTALLTLLYVYAIKPGLECCFPNKSAIVITLSSSYFVLIGLFEGFVMEPVLRRLLTVTRGTEKSNEGLIIGRAMFWAVAVYFYFVILRKYLGRTKQSERTNKLTTD